jgi:hypothetical protein
VPYAALHFSTYERFRAEIAPRARALRARSQPGGRTPVWVDLLAGSCAGATAVSLTYPLDLVRTRLAWDVEARAERGAASILGTVRGIVQHEGLRGLYRVRPHPSSNLCDLLVYWSARGNGEARCAHMLAPQVPGL